MLYFSFGTSKSDIDGYRQAMEAWRERKAEIDADKLIRPRPHDPEYKAAIHEWTLALQISVEAGDQHLPNKRGRKLKS